MAQQFSYPLPPRLRQNKRDVVPEQNQVKLLPSVLQPAVAQEKIGRVVHPLAV